MNTPTFKDNFSQQAGIYVQYRPHYPVELYSYLAALTDEHELAWDCGTGNGQAAVGLADFYNQVAATDPSTEQLRHCLPHEKVRYRVEKAENTALGSHSVDLLTVASALHWFDFAEFYKEVNRVLKPNGVVAAWAYGVPTISPEIDAIVNHFHDFTLNAYWLAENRLIEQGYATLPFPFSEINAPNFYYQKPMRCADLIGYLNTWSATQRFIRKHNFNPTEQVFQELRAVWPDNQSEKTATWKLILKVGRVSRR